MHLVVFLKYVLIDVLASRTIVRYSLFLLWVGVEVFLI